MRNLVFEYIPSVASSFISYVFQGPALFRTAVIAAMIERIVDDDTDDVDLMAAVLAPVAVERLLQQREPYRREVLRPDWNENVAGGRICRLREYGFSGSAVDHDEIPVRKNIRIVISQEPASPA